MTGWPEEIGLAIEKRFLETGHPAGITHIHGAGQGDFGRMSEDGKTCRGECALAHDGLLTCSIHGHVGCSFKVTKQIADNKILAYNIPLGVVGQIWREVGRGFPGLLTKVGLGTFMDPRFDGAMVNEKTKKEGKQIISWHAKYIWDKLKNSIKTDNDAKELSSIMVKCHQNVLYLFAKIYESCGEEYLIRFLHPEYSIVDYRFENFDPFNWSKLRVISNPLVSKNKLKNQERYVRIAFESLAQFAVKDNRKTELYLDEFGYQFNQIITLIRSRLYNQADIKLKELIVLLSDKIYINCIK
jgi:propionate CoA-transferase